MKKPVRGTIADDPGALEARIEELERKFDRLRGLYESYFLGVERAAPAVARRDMNRLVLELQQATIPNAGLRFRVQTLMQKWVLYTTYWNRTLREIESGTYRRDVARAQRHLAERGGALTESEAIALGIPANRARAFVERQSKLRGKAAAPPAPSAPATNAEARPPTPARGISEDEIRAFYGRYVDARRSSGDPRPALSFEQMRDRLLAQAPKLLEDPRVHRVSLDVVVEQGKVRVLATPVRK